MGRSSTQGLGPDLDPDRLNKTAAPAFERRMHRVVVLSGRILAVPAPEGIGLAGPEVAVVAACTVETASAHHQPSAPDRIRSPCSSPLFGFDRSRARRALAEGAAVALTWPTT